MDALFAVRETDGHFSRSDPGVRPLYSITKAPIAAAVITMGIGLERCVSDWIGPDWVPRGSDITVRQLLNHTSGLRDYGALPEYCQAVAAGDAPWSDDTFADHTLRQPLLFEPGAAWAYSNPGYWLLKQILEREAGAPLENVLQRQVLEPLELADTRVVVGPVYSDLPVYDAGWVWHGMLAGTARDMTTFMASELASPLYAESVPVGVSDPPLWRNPRYGLGLMTEPGHRFGHTGEGPATTTACFHFLETGRTVCALARGASTAAVMARVVELGEC